MWQSILHEHRKYLNACEQPTHKKQRSAYHETWADSYYDHFVLFALALDLIINETATKKRRPAIDVPPWVDSEGLNTIFDFCVRSLCDLGDMS